ncbi:MAG: hypothetical protein KJN71_00655, partial [Acidimicrobiia bacterium]|nr:hypothetical protein [Acidimicrobiia bacterium]
MEDRIEIPTSDDDAPPYGSELSGAGVWWIAGVVGLLALIGGVVAASNPASETSEPGELVAPSTAGLPEPDAVAVEFPGFGGVTALVILHQDLLAVVSGNWGSTVWRLDAADDVWRIADFFPGVSLVDAVAIGGDLVMAGFETIDAGSIVLTGEPGSMRAIDLEIADHFVPTRIRVADTGTFVLTAVGGRSATFLGGPALWIHDGTATVLDPGSRSGIEDVVDHAGEVFAFGSDSGRPAKWAISRTGGLEPRELDLDLGPVRVAAAAVTPSGMLIGLAVGQFGGPLDSTAVVDLDAPHTILDLPTAGVWNELAELPDGLVALPADGSVAYRTSDGVEWAFERVKLTPSDVDLALQDVLVLAPGHEVFAGAAAGGEGVRIPALASNARLGADFELPEGGWTFIEPVDEIGIVHLGRIHVGIDGGVVVVRPSFGEEWFQPVFADVPSVGGRVEVYELNTGYLLTASRPFEGLWYSPEGRAWQLIENGLLRVAVGGGDDALVVAEGEMSRVTPDGVVPVDTAEEFVSFLGGVFDWVDGVGYVTQRPDGTLLRSADGSVWSDLGIDAEEGEALVVNGRLATGQGGRWRVLDPTSGGLRAVTVPQGAAVDSLTEVRRGVVLVRDRARLWLSDDLETWVDA